MENWKKYGYSCVKLNFINLMIFRWVQENIKCGNEEVTYILRNGKSEGIRTYNSLFYFI